MTIFFSADWTSTTATTDTAAVPKNDLFNAFSATSSQPTINQTSGAFADFDAFGGIPSGVKQSVSPAPATNNVDLFANFSTATPVAQTQVCNSYQIFKSNIKIWERRLNLFLM